jgi:crossover junction endodeoxyribonuclease RuvC
MLVLGIDPGSVNTGWALLESVGKKVNYVDSGVLSFNGSVTFLERLGQIKCLSDKLVEKFSPDDIAFESLIFVKNPSSALKLAQARGIILSSFVEKYQGRIFEYAPTLVKSSASGHGHADKESMQKFMDMVTGKREYKTHDESDAVAIALCHILNKDSKLSNVKKTKGGRGLAASLAHKV